jgi:hypothetical protein
MPSDRWEYGGAYLRHPIKEKRVCFDDGSIVQPHNIFEPPPEFMAGADVLFVDPPWNVGNLNSFYTKAGRTDHQDNFKEFMQRLFVCIAWIRPKVCYLEVGKEHLADFVMGLRDIYRHVTFYNSTYYHKAENFCYVVRGSGKRKKLPLDGMDEADIIAWVCANEEFSCIGDLCMGRGLVGINAHANGRRFVGTELNHKRLAVLVEKLSRAGLGYQLENIERKSP